MDLKHKLRPLSPKCLIMVSISFFHVAKSFRKCHKKFFLGSFDMPSNKGHDPSYYILNVALALFDYYIIKMGKNLIKIFFNLKEQEQLFYKMDGKGSVF